MTARSASRLGLLIATLLCVGCGDASAPNGKWSVTAGPYSGGTLTITGRMFDLQFARGERATGELEPLGDGKFQLLAAMTDDTQAADLQGVEGAPWYGLQLLEPAASGGPQRLRGPVFRFSPGPGSAGNGAAGTTSVEVLFWFKTDSGDDELKSLGTMTLQGIAD